MAAHVEAPPLGGATLPHVSTTVFSSPAQSARVKKSRVSALSAFLAQLRQTTGIVPRPPHATEHRTTSTLPPIGRSTSLVAQSRIGGGSQRRSRDLRPTPSKTRSPDDSPPGEVRPQTRLDDDAEAVLELIDEDLTWSEESIKFRDIAIKTPDILDFHFVVRFFRTLRIVDKDVTHIGHGLLNFESLEELSLSGNRLSTIDAQNFPPSLRVLHLCANRISDIAPLTTMPQLVHLGVGYNHLDRIPAEISASTWPQMLSLDLSYNNLSDLVGLVSTVRQLPKLRSLVTCGNPFTLLPQYRAYVIDSLPRLLALDDNPAKESEREQFAGASTARDTRLDGVVVHVTVGRVDGLARIGGEHAAAEMGDAVHGTATMTNLQQLPPVEYKYYVEYEALDPDAGPLIGVVGNAAASGSTCALPAGGPAATAVVGPLDDAPVLRTVRRATPMRAWPQNEPSIDFGHADDLPETDLVRLRDFARRGMVVSVFAEKTVWILKEKEREQPPEAATGAELAADPSVASMGRPDSRGSDGRKQSAASTRSGNAKDRQGSAQQQAATSAKADRRVSSAASDKSKKDQKQPAPAQTPGGKKGGAPAAPAPAAKAPTPAKGKKKGKEEADKEKDEAFERIALPPERIFLGTACLPLTDLLQPGGSLAVEDTLVVSVLPEVVQAAERDLEGGLPVVCNGYASLSVAVGVTVQTLRVRQERVTVMVGH